MSVLTAILDATRSGAVDIIDLTTPLQDSTPILQLPEPFANTIPFRLEEISRYDDRGPAWYWNDIHTGEHTGTHLDAPVHWVTGKDGHDVSQVPLRTLIAPAAVIDMSAEVAGDPDFLLQVDHVTAWEKEHGPLPEQGWLLYRTGWEARARTPPSSSTGRTRRACPPNAPAGWRRRRRSPESAWRRWAPTRVPRPASTRRSPATTCCSARTSGA